MRRWNGDDGYRYMVLSRPMSNWQTTFADSDAPSFTLLDGPWQKMDHDGDWGSPISAESLRNGEGGIYRSTILGSCTSPPNAPTLASPSDGAAAGTYQPSLCVYNAPPVSGCDETMVYTFEVYYDPDLTLSVAAPVSVVEQNVTTCWTSLTPLDAGRIYWWRVRSNNGVFNSTWAGPFSFSTPNTTPPAPTGVAPAEGDTVGTAAPVITVNQAPDPDGDPLTYSFEVYDAGMTVLLVSTNGVSSGAQTTGWTVSINLAADQTYLWRARCFDGSAYSTWSTAATFTISSGQGVNHPPTLPVHILPTNGATITGEAVSLVIQNSIDVDGDSLFYDFFIYLYQSMAGLVGSVRNLPETPGQTSTELPFTPVNGQVYWWRVGANDRVHWTEFTEPTSFRWVSLATDADEYIAGTDSPPQGAVVHTRTPILRARNITDPGVHYYHFDVSTDSVFVNPVASSPPIVEGEGGDTEWKVTEPLESKQTYYWRVRADNNDYSTVSSFTIDAIIFASPNPVSFNSGQVVTFHLPSDPVDLLIQTVSGETVLVEENISGEWVWYGRNASGNDVSVGVYSWFVRGSDYNGKIVVKP